MITITRGLRADLSEEEGMKMVSTVTNTMVNSMMTMMMKTIRSYKLKTEES